VSLGKAGVDWNGGFRPSREERGVAQRGIARQAWQEWACICPDCLTWHAANGGKRSKETARLMKRLGVLPGVFDLVVLAPGPRTFFLEAKADKGKLSEDQQWFKGELIKMGFPYVVFRSA
jgi:hypothetical protein